MISIILVLLLVCVGLLCLCLTYIIVDQNKIIQYQKRCIKQLNNELSHRVIQKIEVLPKDIKEVYVSYIVDERERRNMPMEVYLQQLRYEAETGLMEFIHKGDYIVERKTDWRQDRDLYPGQTRIDLRLKISK